MPYYTTPQFMAILNILRLEPHPHLSFLKPVKKSRSELPQKHLIDSLIGFPESLRYVAQILPSFLHMNRNRIHQPLLGFHLATFLGIFETLATKSALREPFPQPVLAAILPPILEGLKTPILDVKITTYILLTKLALSSALESSMLTHLTQSLIENFTEYPTDQSNISKSPGWTEHDEALVKTLIIWFQCDSSGSSPHLSTSSCHTLAAIPGSAKLLMHLCETVEMSAFWSAFIQGLAQGALKKDLDSTELLYQFSQMFITSTPLLETTIRIMLSTSAALETPAPCLLRPLTIISQRHPDSLEKVAHHLIANGDVNTRQAVENLLRLVSGGIELISPANQGDLLELSSSSAILRHSALRRILEQHSSESPKKSTQSDIVNPAIKLALRDPDPTVTEVLFAYPRVINNVVTEKELLSIACSIFTSPHLSRATCMSWLSFLSGPFLDLHPSMASQVAEDLVLDRLFWTKSHAKATTVIWSSGLPQRHQTWLGTILEGIHQGAATSEDPVDRIAANEAMLNIIATGAIKMGDSTLLKLLQRLKVKYQSKSSLARLVPLMVLRQTIPSLSQGMLCQLVNAIVDHQLCTSDGDSFTRWIDSSVDPLANNTDSIKENFYSKSSSEKLFSRISADTLLKALSQIHRPQDLAYCWFETNGQPSNSTSSTTGPNLASDILKLHYKLYSVGHSGGTNAKRGSLGRTLIVTLLRHLLGDESLIFLARIWTSSSYSIALRIMALQDAAAEIKALSPQNTESGSRPCKDFQLLIPSILIALTDPVRSVRSAALELITSISESLVNGHEQSTATETDIYAYDCFYGPRASTGLQYLSIVDSNHIIKAILEHKDEIMVNGLIVLRQLLGQLTTPRASKSSSDKTAKPSGGDTGKKSMDDAIKRKVLCFFMKVVNCWEDLEGRIKILRCLTEMTDPSRMHLVSPLLQQLSKGTGVQPLATDPSSSSALKEYASLLLQTYVAPGKSFRAGKDLPSYEVFVAVLECSPDISMARTLPAAAVERLESSLFLDLSPAHKEDILRRILILASSERDNRALFVACLRHLPIDSVTFIRLLTSLVAQIATKRPVSHKKAKTASGATLTITATSDISTLSILLEMVSMDKLTQSFELFAVLLETLRVLLVIHGSKNGDIGFPAQLVIAGMASVIAKLDPDQFKPHEIQLTPIVDYMRISLDPHVSQQTILLMAELARLCPDQTCQSMMPIFTFVGTHVIQRDDAFSARVVDKAIQALIPPIIQNVRSKGTTRVQLIIHLRDLLMMFVGARNHIPKHRRTRLFVRLIEVLGPYHFLGAVMMLLVDAGRDEVGGSSASDLALSVWESFPGEICVAHFSDPDAMVEDVPSEAHIEVNISRAKMLMRFIDEALSSKSIESKLNSARSTHNIDADQVLAFFMIQLLEISQPYSKLTSDEQAQEGRAIARKVAKLVALPFFARVLLPKLQNDNDRLVSCALDLLRTRLPLIKPSVRSEVEECVKSAIATCGKRISIGITGPSDSEPHLQLSYAVEILGDIALNSTNSEQSCLSHLYSPLVSMVKSCPHTSLAGTILTVLSHLVKKLGPRLLPHVQMTITTCASLTKDVLTTQHENIRYDVAHKAFALMDITLQNSSSFILPYLVTVVNVLVDLEINQALSRSTLTTVTSSRASLLRTLTKSVPLEELDKTLIKMWPSMDLCCETVLVLLDLLLRAIKHTKVPSAIKESKNIFNFLLMVFDLRRTHRKLFSDADLSEIETTASSVFMTLVLKLNDATLKPLLMRLIDWAAMNDPDDNTDSGIQSAGITKSIPMYRVFATFLDRLQALGVPYYSHLLDHTITLLNGFAEKKFICEELWFQLARTLENALQHDQDGFWTMTRLSKVTRPMIKQLRLAGKIDNELFVPQLKRLICKLSQKVVDHDTLLKVFSSGILEELRSTEEVKVKLAGLSTLEEIWVEIGSSLIGFVPEMVGGYLVEAMEDGEGGIDVAAKRVVKLIEEELGEGIEGYLA
ncbi:uncharacterized protein MELLADRAFT_68623 [Melampsora larici-populina 98AG31]|uniref:U3 small nucleolar RNA-associated protein 10 n=1 Tax=Melampsora larici-populina (strain 98AG31 / pathotype 3-4-7) TaxID=747676 RepID=F4S7G5_MELLP|nr:uncharacterized protein MELLADRAFT_68623 [Melampsora larici-populina 98AG31]EGF99404.1 hypothetical protein MELLADRAFT_68623 [Melampsora larici-populina 98AG31]